MIKNLAKFLLFVAAASAAQAQEITVRSGEHGPFTRLVLELPRGVSWQMEQQETQVSITLDGHRSGFQTGEIFDRIDRTRVADVTTTASAIRIALSCDCEANAFLAGESLLAVDITGVRSEDERTGRIAKAGELLTFGFGTLVPEPENDPASLGLAVFGTVIDLTPPPVVASVKLPVVSEVPRFNVQNLGLSRSVETDTPQAAASLKSMQAELSRGVASAASRGLLVASGANTLPIVPPRPQIDTLDFDRNEPLPLAQVPEQAPIENLRITSTMDFQGSELPAQMMGSRWGPGCISPEVVDIHAWSDDRPLATQIAETRSRLFGEFDTLNTEAAVDLARLYMHFGFGPEAMRLLALDAGMQEEHSILLEMGEIMEFGHARTPRVLKNYVECDSALALWAILSMPTVPSATVLNTDAALRTLSGLPVHLRNFLAPELSRRLLDYGDPVAAGAAVRSLERLAGPVSDETKLAQAGLQLEAGDLVAAKEKLSEVVSSNSEQSAEALIKIVNTALDLGESIPPDMVLLINGYAKEFRNDRLGPALRNTHIMALGRSGQFEAALSAINDLQEGHNQSERAELADFVMSALTDNGDDPEFLSVVFDMAARQGLTVKDGTRAKVAARLFELGFVPAAESILEAAPSVAEEDAVRLLKASIALSMDRPALAEAHLLGINGPSADRLRAQARRLTGLNLEASTLFDAAGDKDAATTMAFLSDDWRTRVSEDTTIIGPLAQMSNMELAADPAPVGMLARTADALDESANARAYIDTILNAPLGDDTASEG